MYMKTQAQGRLKKEKACECDGYNVGWRHKLERRFVQRIRIKRKRDSNSNRFQNCLGSFSISISLCCFQWWFHRFLLPSFHHLRFQAQKC